MNVEYWNDTQCLCLIFYLFISYKLTTKVWTEQVLMCALGISHERLNKNKRVFSKSTTSLFAAFSQGHCYEPFVKYGNLSSSDTTWAVGAVVEFSCDPGYTLEQGSITIECMGQNNPQWNETEPACRG